MSDVAQNRWWDRVDRVARSVGTALIVVVLSGLILLGAAQILLRNLSIGFAWGDGLARLAVLWLGLLGALAASRDGRHIAIGAAIGAALGIAVNARGSTEGGWTAIFIPIGAGGGAGVGAVLPASRSVVYAHPCVSQGNCAERSTSPTK